MVNISDMAISEGAEELKGQPLLLNIFEERTCAVSMRKVVKIRVAEYTLNGHIVSCRDIASLDTRSYLSQQLFDSQGHWVRPIEPHVRLRTGLALLTWLESS